jgi:hypothetical protein
MQKTLALLLLATALVLAVYAISLLWPLSTDYYYYYYPTLIRFLGDQTRLYDTSSPAFYNVPWLLGVWMPFAGFPYPVAQYFNTLLILVCLLASVAMFRRGVPRIAVGFAILNFPCAALVRNGQTDAFVLLGVAIGYVAVRRRNIPLLSVALCLLAIKPVSVILVAIWFLAALRDLRALLLPFAATIFSAFFIGFDWPFRYLTYTLQHPVNNPRVELWRLDISPVFLATLGLIALLAFLVLLRRRGFDDWTFGLALTTNFVFSPYLLWAHYVALIPVFLLLARQHLRLATIVYLSSFLLLWFGEFYPIAMFIALWLIVQTNHTSHMSLDVQRK